MKTNSVIGEDDGKVLPKENINAQVKEKLKRGGEKISRGNVKGKID